MFFQKKNAEGPGVARGKKNCGKNIFDLFSLRQPPGTHECPQNREHINECLVLLYRGL